MSPIASSASPRFISAAIASAERRATGGGATPGGATAAAALLLAGAGGGRPHVARQLAAERRDDLRQSLPRLRPVRRQRLHLAIGLERVVVGGLEELAGLDLAPDTRDQHGHGGVAIDRGRAAIDGLRRR